MAVSDAMGHVTYGELLDAVSRTASWAFSLPERVALMAPKNRHGIVWHLALAWAGRTIVTLPEFFSPAQLAHAIRDSGAEAVVVSHDALESARAAGWRAVVPDLGGPAATEAAGAARLITYTSGTTGRPKGVVLGEAQVNASIRGMVEAVGAGKEDRMLSVLPLALLLEQVAGMAVPLLAGAAIVLCDDPRSLPVMAEAAAPTVTILVPEMLSGWVRWLERSDRRAPASLRFVAVGGASIAPGLAERAWRVGLPVHEGYGLSECCSVVAVNRPGHRVAGTVGPPLPGIEVTIQGDEIIVSGPTVMERYLGGAAVSRRPSDG